MKLKKRGFTEQDIFIAVVVAVVVLVIVANFSGVFAGWFGGKTLEESCRLSVLANAKVRYSDYLLFGKAKERIAINCPSKEDLEITYSDAKEKTLTGSTGAIEYSIMRLMAEELKECHYKYAGDIDGLIPFANEENNYCGICRKISFDEKIQETDFNSGAGTGKLNNFYTYLVNAQMDRSTQYYSEYLYDYKKIDEGGVEEFGSIFESSDVYDLDVDTTKEYYVMHMVIKDSRSWKELKKYLGNDNTACVGLGGAIGATGAILAPASLGASLVVGGIVGGAVMLACKSTQIMNKEHDFLRFTTIFPVEEFNGNSINCIPYGLEKQNEATS